MNRSLLRHGFILVLLSLFSAFFIPKLAIPRLGLSAHTIGILSGTLLIAIAAVWQQFSLSSRQQVLMYWSWVYSSYANWLGCLLGALFGAGKMTPVAAAGTTGSAFAEAIVAFLLVSVAVVSLIAVGLSIWGLRSKS